MNRTINTKNVVSLDVLFSELYLFNASSMGFSGSSIQRKLCKSESNFSKYFLKGKIDFKLIKKAGKRNYKIIPK